MPDSIFTKIIKGQVPCHKIYEDQKTFAFLTIEPSMPGHTLVVPKLQVDQLWDLPAEDYQAVMETSKKVALRLKEVMGTNRVGVKVIGEEVPHAHIHLIPINSGQDYYQKTQAANPEDLAAIAAKLAF